ncbi:MAG: transposase [Magnetococcales bacterium]|nr:transposase [Magnetococcales bacterium]MBF0113742.1 transposase [Magnetococcales bacterium]
MEIVRKGNFTLKQIFHDNWDRFLAVYPTLVTWYVAYNVWKILNCREPDGLGYATYACPDHPDETCHIPRSCKSRFCSVCAKVQSDNWVANVEQMFPNCNYFHITFTVPSQFRELLFEKRSLLNAVFAASTETLITFCAEQGFYPAIIAVLHTFGSDLKRHVHIHIIISAGGLMLSGKAERYTRFIERKKKDPTAKQREVFVVTDNPQWIHYSGFPPKMLHKRYQALLIKHLKRIITKNLESESPDPDFKPFSDPDVMRSFFDDLRKIYQQGFFVHASGERQKLKCTVKYIGRYARRPPLSELRIIDYTGEMITFQFKDYRNHERPVLYTLRTIEFIRKLIRHIPPHYFNVIRHYGLLASRVKTAYKQITDKLLPNSEAAEPALDWRTRQTLFRGKDPMICTICKKAMVFVSAHLPNPLSHVKAKLQAAYP